MEPSNQESTPPTSSQNPTVTEIIYEEIQDKAWLCPLCQGVYIDEGCTEVYCDYCSPVFSEKNKCILVCFHCEHNPCVCGDEE